MRPNKRYVWPILAWLSGGMFASLLVTIFLTAFVDGRWGPFILVSSIASVVCVSVTAAAASEGATYTKKPRGWRQMRRDAEREAYIKQLEKEAFGDD